MVSIPPNDIGFHTALRRLLNEARTRLIQADGRNRLIHTPRDAKRSKSLKIIDTSADHVFHLLVREHSSVGNSWITHRRRFSLRTAAIADLAFR